MADFATRRPGDDLLAAAERWPHLARYLEGAFERTGEYPALIEKPTKEYESPRPNVLYPLGDGVFVNIHGDVGVTTAYHPIEPSLTEDERALYDEIRRAILDRSAGVPAPSEPDAFAAHLDDLFDSVALPETSASLVDSVRASLFEDTFLIDTRTKERLRYYLHRDIAGYGPLEPLVRDLSNEDIHVVGPTGSYVNHGVYGLIETGVEFPSERALSEWVKNMGERMDAPISDARPIVDATLPNGARVNIVYSDDVSVKGPSLTIRQGEEVPLSILQITNWGTISPELAAYLWLCLENERTVFVVGETASGKTTTLNCMLSFIPRDSKVYTAEDTAEVLPPQPAWQQLLTRESAGGEGTDVDLFDLVAAALRSRPDYIIVGEVRGPEAQMAFQAAQTGHPVILTFHASDIVSMMQRFTGTPINIPETFMDNCNVALFQNRVKRDDQILRRVTSVQEIEGYSEADGGVVTREVFSWDPVDDEVSFVGRNNSYVLEEQVATLLGYEDPRAIYDELGRRAEIIRRLIDAEVLGYHEVNDAIEAFQRDGVAGLPIQAGRLAAAGR